MRGTISIILILAAATYAASTTQPTPAPDAKPTAKAPEAPPRPEVILTELGGEYGRYVEKMSFDGEIDWTAGRVIARGVGKATGASAQAVAMARRAARLVAARNAILLLSRLRIDPEGKTPDIRAGRITLEGVLKDFEETAMAYDPQQRTVSVTLSAPFYGLRGVVRMTGVVTARRAEKWSWPKPFIEDRPIDLIVIDAGETKFAPTMFPRIETAKGRRVLDSGQLPRRQLLRRPMMIYARKRSVPKALAARATPTIKVLTVRASAAKGKAKGTLVLDEAALKTLSANADSQRLMREGRLVVLVRPAAAAK